MKLSERPSFLDSQCASDTACRQPLSQGVTDRTHDIYCRDSLHPMLPTLVTAPLVRCVVPLSLVE